jgi:hypothetical protein
MEISRGHSTQAPGQRLWLDARTDRTPLAVNLQRMLWATPVWLAASLLIAAAAYTSDSHHTSGTTLPAFVYVQLGDGTVPAVDVRLNWTAGHTAGGTRLSAINPNVLVHGDTLLLAARGHALELRTDVGQWGGDVVTHMTTVWRSELLLGEVPLVSKDWDGWDVGRWRLSSPSLARASLLSSAVGDGTPWVTAAEPLCEAPPLFVPANSTLLRKVRVASASLCAASRESSRLTPTHTHTHTRDGAHGGWASE